MATLNSRVSRLQAGWLFWTAAPQSFRIGASILMVHILFAATGPFWAPFGYGQMGTGLPLAGMSWVHPSGVDQLGRDVFSRIVFGAHIVIILSLSGTALGFIAGTAIGLLTAYLGGWVDTLTQRLLEGLISIPFLVLALVAVTAAGPEMSGKALLIILVVAFVNAPRVARMARSAAMDIITKDYVTAARLRGESAWSIMHRELLPNTTSVLLVEFALRAGYGPVLIGSLGFLGFGLRPPTPEWGLMVSEYRPLLIISPVTVLGPALALASLVVGINLFTEGLSRIVGRTARLNA